MTVMQQQPSRYLARPAPSSLADVIDTILDKGLGDESITAQLADRDGGKKGSPTLGIFCMSTDFTHGRRVQDPGSLHASCRLKGTFYA